eukprot:XP_011663136.1 PREDICTED: kinesin-like protein KIF1B [Strongylocentrotus purpuratus]
MNGQSTMIKNPENEREEPKKFAYDFSYWSHDGYKENKEGYLEPTDKKYADQKTVFSDLGQSVLANAWKGYNCCLFAYGQTGSGKSYSIVGYGANKGIVPVACSELFRGIGEKKKNADKSKEEEYQVFVSMLEIYNEQVRDLLMPASFKVKGGLKVREHPQKGFYVEQQATFPVMSYDDINNKINEGTRNRTIASTNMNATSSRAHTIVSIRFIQKGRNETGKNMTKTSIINLVDLAGSERVDSTGATGDRLKEGAAINLSLSSLGNVIKALADMGAGKKGIRVPYRDSKLTMLLKNALGGNSKTIMIAAISPADINFDETLSTLRYADRAKAIKTKAVVNESPTDKLIRELKEENARLLKELQGKGGGGKEAAILQGIPEEGTENIEGADRAKAIKTKAVVNESPTDKLIRELKEENARLLKELQGKGGGGKEAAILQGIPEDEVEEMKSELERQLQQNQSEMESMKKSWEQKLKEVHTAQEQELAKEKKKHEEMKVTPHFWNLNEDPALTGMIIHFIKQGLTKVGSDKAHPAADMVLSGLNMEKEHAVISNRANTVIIKPCLPAKVLVNGKPLTDRGELHHNDRVLFGSKHLYVVHHPQDLAKNPKKEKEVSEEKPTYSKAQEEIAANSGFEIKKGPNRSKGTLNHSFDPVLLFFSPFFLILLLKIGKSTNFKFHVSHARGLPARIAKSFCRYKFYQNREPAQSAEVEGRNPEYKHDKIFSTTIITPEMLKYLENESLIIEVWGRQRDMASPERRSLGGDIKRSTSITSDEKYKLNVELNTEKKRVQRLEAKLQKIQELVSEAVKHKKKTLDIIDVQEVLYAGGQQRFKAAATVIGLTEQMGKVGTQGKV